MAIVFWPIIKNYRDFIRHVKFQITNAVCWTSLFTCIMAMISNFLIIYNPREFFYEIFSANIAYFSIFAFNSLFVSDNIFFFLNPIILVACFFKGSQNFFHTIYMVKSPNCWHWISARNMFTYFYCWGFLWVVCASFYSFN